MIETLPSEDQAALRLPIMTVRSFLLGMTAMNVLNGIMILFVVCLFPLTLLLIAGIQHPSIFKLHIFFVGFLAIGISFGLNVLCAGAWCFRQLFMSLDRRILAAAVLLAWHLVLRFLNQADYLDIGLVAAVLFISLWDRLYVARERP
jgi:hypothetical protein